MPRRPSKNAGKITQKSTALHREVKYLSVGAVGILLTLVMLFPGNMGGVGNILRSLLFGFFGYGAFVLPVGTLAVAVFGLFAREVRIPVVKIVAVFWLVLSLLHIFIFTRTEGVFIFVDVYTAGLASGGGILGMLIGGPSSALLGIGAPIAILATIIILLVLITRRSFIQIVGAGVEAAREYYEESREYELENRVHEEANIIPINKQVRGKLVKPPPSNMNSKKKSNIIDIGGQPERPFKQSSQILLVGEELGDRKREWQAASPLFTPRPEMPEKQRNPVVSFPAPVFEENSQTQVYSEETFVEDTYNGEIFVENQAEEFGVFQENTYQDTVSESGEVVADEYYYEEPSYEDEPVILPVAESGADFGEGVVVRGLVDGGETEGLAPMYADSDDDDLLEYDEFAMASGTGGKSTGSAGISSPANFHSPNRPPSTGFVTHSPQDFENYEMPSLELLTKNERAVISAESRTQVLENSRILEETLRSFKIEAKVIEVSVGPTVTRYDLSPGTGVKVSSILNLTNDLALSLAAQGLRIEAPIPGKSAIGIEIPNKEAQGVFLREILEDERFANFPSKLAFAVGKDIAGSPIITDVARMPHLLIAGATGSGKSVCINTLIASLLYKARPDEVKLLMIDPKVVELSVYNGIPHLLIPVVTEPKKASGALSWAVQEMETRYNLFAETGCRDLKGYNKYLIESDEQELPQIVIIIDELADLMMTCKGEVEESICRLAQKARAAGIHLIVATQRPSVDVITGLIKANIPSRLAFAVSSGTDSRTVLDMYGAEKLLGKGDMLFLPMGQNKPIRVQGGYISDKEVENLVSFLKAQAPVVHSAEDIQRVTMPGKVVPEGEVDEFFHDAVDFLLVKGKGSTSMLQRQFRIGYNRASRLMDDLERRGIVGSEDGVKPRKVTITREEYRELYGQNN